MPSTSQWVASTAGSAYILLLTAVQVSIWYGCVLRGDLNHISVGAFSNVQDRTVIHAARWDSLSLCRRSNSGYLHTICI